jgi:hypothetical protein
MKLRQLDGCEKSTLKISRFPRNLLYAKVIAYAVSDWPYFETEGQLVRKTFLCIFSGAVLLTRTASLAQFASFAGNASQEQAWHAALGGLPPLEDFESFQGVAGPGTGGDLLTSLPSLRVMFDPIVPGIYVDGQWAHSGTKQCSN